MSYEANQIINNINTNEWYAFGNCSDNCKQLSEYQGAHVTFITAGVSNVVVVDLTVVIFVTC